MEKLKTCGQFVRYVLRNHPCALIYYAVLLLACGFYCNINAARATANIRLLVTLPSFFVLIGLVSWIGFGRSNIIYRITFGPLLVAVLAVPMRMIGMETLRRYPAELFLTMEYLALAIASVGIHAATSRHIVVTDHSPERPLRPWWWGSFLATYLAFLFLLTHIYHTLIPFTSTWIHHLPQSMEEPPNPHALLLLVPMVQILALAPGLCRAIIRPRLNTSIGHGEKSMAPRHTLSQLTLGVFSAMLVCLLAYISRDQLRLPDRQGIDDLVGLVYGAFILLVYFQLGIAVVRGSLRRWFQNGSRARQASFYCIYIPFLPLAILFRLLVPRRRPPDCRFDSPWLHIAFSTCVLATAGFALAYSSTSQRLSTALVLRVFSQDSSSSEATLVPSDRLIRALNRHHADAVNPGRQAMHQGGPSLALCLRANQDLPRLLSVMQSKGNVGSLDLDFSEARDLSLGQLEIRSLKCLRVLNVDDTSTVGDLSELKHLHTLHFAGCGTVDIGAAGIPMLRSLHSLHIGPTVEQIRERIRQSQRPGSGMPPAGDNPSPTSIILGSDLLRSATTLKRLSLNYCHLANSDLAFLEKLINLESLDLDHAQITDSGLLHLKGLIELEWLDLKGTKVTDTGVTELQKALPNCEISH